MDEHFFRSGHFIRYGAIKEGEHHLGINKAMFKHASESPSLSVLFRQMEVFFMGNTITYAACDKCEGVNQATEGLSHGA